MRTPGCGCDDTACTPVVSPTPGGVCDGAWMRGSVGRRGGGSSVALACCGMMTVRSFGFAGGAGSGRSCTPLSSLRVMLYAPGDGSRFLVSAIVLAGSVGDFGRG